MSESRPNIVLVITDQQRFDTIAALGHDHVDTPNLDRLVREGTAFTHTYVSAPSCSPSRASLFTGVYPHSLGVLRNEELWRHSWVETLADSGYHCVNVGKMHTHPWETPLGFHERTVVENKDRDHPNVPFFHDQWDKALWALGERKPTRTTYREREDYAERLGAFEWTLDEEMHSDVFVAGHARWWLDTYPGDEPFFLQIGFPGPHPPYDPVPRHLEPYRDRDVPLPIVDDDDTVQPDVLQELREHHQENDHDAIVHLASPTEEQSLRQRRHYLANVTMIDEQIGLLLDALERRGVLDNTVILFTSDHGDCLGDHGHSQKWTMYESSVRVPAIVWGPGRVVAGQRIDSLTSMMDFGPTVLELAGLTPPHWMEAQSLVPALRGEPWQGREYVFSEHARDMILTGTELMTMVRDDRWKLVEFLDSEQGQLFDLQADPQERYDLWSAAEDAEASKAKARLLGVIAQWRAHSALHTADRGREYR
ncbi:sulfatase family protein [Saccharopolyspora phatthalungensis]|uniref:Arylsulfatase A-like enzyme n=1 Tax=Saccharopolyspora phatthalungensis TaxID=664693 RepID=A0A840Q251_9PSEU|nr:sulfatase-like hydrolase/transferase [Saccharopolyspora phatthalungensis]MBB5156592.1 arylsulfatase A-like enzyme [Saccharopolyspora phatthalungensis]